MDKHDLENIIQRIHPTWDIVSFMELYQEILYDLLSDKPTEQCTLKIREDTTKGIHIPNLTEVEVNLVKSVLDALQKGTSRRASIVNQHLQAAGINMHKGSVIFEKEEEHNETANSEAEASRLNDVVKNVFSASDPVFCETIPCF